MLQELPESNASWVGSIALLDIGGLTLIAEKVANVRTSTLRLASQSDAEIHDMPAQTRSLKPAALLFAPCCNWPVRIWRAAETVAASMVVEAMKISPSSRIENSS